MQINDNSGKKVMTVDEVRNITKIETLLDYRSRATRIRARGTPHDIEVRVSASFPLAL